MGSVNSFTDNASETINYVSVHDNLCLWDKIIISEGLAAQEGFLAIKNGVLLEPDATTYDNNIPKAIAEKTRVHSSINKNDVFANITVKRDVLAYGIILTSQGVAFISEGDEILRTKYGECNSYRGPIEINEINWQWKVDFKPVFDYYKGLITLRKTHPAFQMDSKDTINNNLKVFKQDNNIVAFQIINYANGDTWKNIIIIYNAGTNSQNVDLPETHTWNVVVDNRKSGVDILKSFTGNTVNVEGVSMMVFYSNE
jgi:pullulanase